MILLVTSCSNYKVSAYFETRKNRKEVKEYVEEHYNSSSIVGENIGHTDYLAGKGVDSFFYKDETGDFVYRIDMKSDGMVDYWPMFSGGAKIRDWLMDEVINDSYNDPYYVGAYVYVKGDSHSDQISETLDTIMAEDTLEKDIKLVIGVKDQPVIDEYIWIYNVYEAMANKGQVFNLRITFVDMEYYESYISQIDNSDFSLNLDDDGVYAQLVKDFSVDFNGVNSYEELSQLIEFKK